MLKAQKIKFGIDIYLIQLNWLNLLILTQFHWLILGTGAGFPGLVVEIFNKNKAFHVKLYEKSPVKRRFLMSVIKELSLNAEVLGDVRDEVIDSEIIICRAFKKLDQVIQVSREIAKKPHKLMILKGQNAQEEIKKFF